MTNTYNKIPDIQRKITINADIQKVWSAISSSDALAKWFMPNNFQPIIGHEFTFQSQPQRGWDGIVYCKVMELDPPNKLGFTWQGNNMNQYVSFELKQVEASTELTLIHGGWTEEHAEIREIMYDGWGYILEGFKNKLGDEENGLLN